MIFQNAAIRFGLTYSKLRFFCGQINRNGNGRLLHPRKINRRDYTIASNLLYRTAKVSLTHKLYIFFICCTFLQHDLLLEFGLFWQHLQYHWPLFLACVVIHSFYKSLWKFLSIVCPFLVYYLYIFSLFLVYFWSISLVHFLACFWCIFVHFLSISSPFLFWFIWCISYPFLLSSLFFYFLSTYHSKCQRKELI